MEYGAYSTGIHIHRELVMIDSLCDNDADSASLLLHNIDVGSLGDDDLWYYRLLCVKADDKRYVKTKDTGRAAELVEHFERVGGDKRLLPVAYYYLGGAYRDLDDYPMALEYYYKSLDVAAEEDKKFVGALNFQIGYLLLEQSLYRQAIPHFVKSQEIEMGLRDTVMATYALQKVAYAYQELSNDSCLAYLNKAAKLIGKTDDRQTYNDILSSLASYYLGIHDYARAKEYAMPAVWHKSDRPASYASVLDVAAESYLGLGLTDSAEYYFKELECQNTLEAKYASSKNLFRIYCKKGDCEKMRLYSGMYEMYADSMDAIKATVSVAKLHAAYNYNTFKSRNADLARRNALLLYLLSLAVISVVFCAILLVIQRRLARRREKDRERRFKNTRDKFVRQNNEQKLHYESKIKELERRVNEFTADCQKVVPNDDTPATHNGDEADRQLVINENALRNLSAQPIYKAVLKIAENGGALSDEVFLSLDRLAALAYPDFKSSLYSVYAFSEQDYRLCLLIKLYCFTDKTLSVLLNRSRSTITKAKKKLGVKLVGSGSCANEFENYIRSL